MYIYLFFHHPNYTLKQQLSSSQLEYFTHFCTISLKNTKIKLKTETKISD